MTDETATGMALRAIRNEIIEQCAKVADGWLIIHGDNEIEYTSAREYACDAVADIADAIRALAVPSTHRESPTASSPGGSAPSQRLPE